MSISDYDEVADLWRACEGVGLDPDTDSRDNTQAYLERNPGLSFVARVDGVVVGAVLSGHDGRRGYLHHLAVDSRHRREGIGARLVDCCITGLRSVGIRKCNIFVFADNELGNAFWRASGWNERSDLLMMQKWTCPSYSGSEKSC